MPNQSMTYGVETSLSKNTFTRPGYTFTGWKMNDKDNGTSYHDEDIVKNLTDVDGGTVTMYAQWIKNGYVIKYDRNGGTGSMPDQTMQYDTPANLTKNAFTREGYSFTGWRLGDASSGTEYTDEQSVTNLTESDNGSVTMYAQWSPISYTIAFDKNRTDAIGTTSSMSMKFDVAKNLTANGFSSASSKFVGWNENADGTGTAYKDGQNVKNLTSTDGATVTLYAIWSTNTYTVSFVDGHDGTAITTARIPYGGNATPPTKPYHDGYTPTSWDGDYTNVTSDRTITINYRPNAYRIAFKSNGGTGSMPNQDMEYGRESALNSNLFTKTGYTFSGWRLGNNNTGTQYSDRQRVVNLTSVEGDVVTMYAQWTPNRYTIKYNSNCGTGTMPNQSMTYDVSSKLDANRFTRSGYTWIGWRRDDATSGKAYRNRQEVVNLLSANGGTTTMYAQWSPNSYTVTFIDGFDKKTIATQGVNYGQPAKEPARPSHTGYTATGWDSDFSNVRGDMTVTFNYVSNLSDTDGDTVTLYAVWDELDHATISYIVEPVGSGIVTRTSESLNPETGTSEGSKAVPNEGYEFIGWYIGDTLVTKNDELIPQKPQDGWKTTTYTAMFKKKTFTVTFISKSNDILKEETVEYGDGATAPDALHVDGYEFIGWDKAFDNVTEDITVTALYRELPIAPAPAAPEPTPEPAAESPASDVQTDDLIQTGISVAPIAMAGGFAGIAAIAARRRKSTKR